MKAEKTGLARRTLFVDVGVWEQLAARARAEQVSLATLVRRLLSAAVDGAEAQAGAVGKTTAERLLSLSEELRDEVRDQVILLAAIGRAAIGIQQLLVHWATREDALGISEDELMAQVQTAGDDGWQQLMDDVWRPTKAPKATNQKNRSPSHLADNG